MEDFVNDVEQPGPSSEVGVGFWGGVWKGAEFSGWSLEGGFMRLCMFDFFLRGTQHDMRFLSQVNVSIFTTI